MHPRWRRIALAVFLLAYFLYFEWDTLKVHFASDELFSMWLYWHEPYRMLAAQFKLWEFYFRPTVGLFYVPLFLGFGLNPVPYHAALLALLAAGVWQTWRFARVLGAEELPAALAALIACYHAGLNTVYYATSFIADALCGLLYLTAFVYYARIRASGRIPSLRQTLTCLAIYVLAFNSKETAASLPLLVLAYEAIYHGPLRHRWKQLRVVGGAVGLNLFFLYTRMFAPNALRHQPGYHLVFSRARVLDFQTKSLSDFFLTYHLFDWRWVLSIWAILTFIAFRRQSPVLRFCWVWMLLTPLAIFFADNRHGGNLYTSLPGWAVFAAIVLADVIRAASGFLAGEPIFRRLGRPAITALLTALLVFGWARENRWFQQTHVRPDMENVSPEHWDAMQQLSALHPAIRPGSKVVFLDDPLPNFDMALIAELTFRDRTVSVRLNRATPLPPEMIAAADYVFTWRSGKLVQVR